MPGSNGTYLASLPRSGTTPTARPRETCCCWPVTTSSAWWTHSRRSVSTFVPRKGAEPRSAQAYPGDPCHAGARGAGDASPFDSVFEHSYLAAFLTPLTLRERGQP